MRALMISLALLAVTTLTTAQEPQNLLTNPGFEEIENGEVVGWAHSMPAGAPEYAIEQERGGNVVRMTANSPEDHGRWHQDPIEVVPDVTVYRLSADVRTDLEDCSARVVVVYHKDGTWHSANYQAIVVEGETDWQRHQVLIEPRAGTTHIQVQLRLNFDTTGTGTAWFDDIALEPLPGVDSVPPIEYKPAREMPEVSEDAREAGFAVFPRRPENIAMPGYVPSADEIRQPVEAWGATGQRLTASFCIRALQDLGDVSVSLHGLPDAEISILPARVLTRYIHRSMPDAIEVPTYFEPVETMDIASGQTAWYWLTIEGLPEGRHEGMLAIRVGGQQRASLPVHLQVLPIDLQEPEAALGFYYIMRYYEGQPERIRAHFRQMRERHMTSIGIVAGLHMENQNGAPVVIWDDENELGVGMDLWAEQGFTQPVIWLMHRIQRFCFDEFGPLESEAFAAAYRSIIEQVEARAGEQGWPEIIYQPVDEPVHNENRMAIALRCLPLIQQAGARTEEDGNLRPGDEDFEAMYPNVDLVNCNFRRHVEQQKLGIWESEMVRRCREDGKLLWTYNIDLCGYHPEVMRFGMGFGREACHSGGMIEWQWQSPREDPYVLDEKRRQNMTYWYAPAGDRQGGPSTGLEGAAEGAIDAAYLATFNAAVAKARASADADRRALADQAVADYEAQLAKLYFTDLNTTPAIQGEWTVPRHPDEEGYLKIGGEYKMPNGWDFADYDRTRRLLADWVVRLGE